MNHGWASRLLTLARRSGRRSGGGHPAGEAATRWRFHGTITGLGTTSGTRLVIGEWADSPFGRFGDVMVEHPDGQRVLLAPTAEVADFVSATYSFDHVVEVPVDVRHERRRVHLTAGPLIVHLAVGPRTMLGRLLRLVPARLATSPRWLDLLAPVVHRVLPGVRVKGSAGGGRQEWYGATDAHAVTVATASWDGADLGTLARVEPPTRFGFSSTPARPLRVAVVTTVSDRPARPTP